MAAQRPRVAIANLRSIPLCFGYWIFPIISHSANLLSQAIIRRLAHYQQTPPELEHKAKRAKKKPLDGGFFFLRQANQPAYAAHYLAAEAAALAASTASFAA